MIQAMPKTNSFSFLVPIVLVFIRAIMCGVINLSGQI